MNSVLSTRFKTQQRRMEEIASAMGTYVPPISGKPFKARKADALENDLEELKREHGVKHPVSTDDRSQLHDPPPTSCISY